MSLEMVLSCKELGLFRSQLLQTGDKGTMEEGAEEEEEEETDGATVNIVLLDDVSVLSDLKWLLVEGKIKQLFSVSVEMISDLLTSLCFAL